MECNNLEDITMAKFVVMLGEDEAVVEVKDGTQVMGGKVMAEVLEAEQPN
jgi:hypothetical protein